MILRRIRTREEDVKDHGFEFEDKMASRARSLPISQHLLADVDTSRNVDSAPDKMRRRGSVREGRRNSEVPHTPCVHSIKDKHTGYLLHVMCT